jgi:hypothetical protein
MNASSTMSTSMQPGEALAKLATALTHPETREQLARARFRAGDAVATVTRYAEGGFGIAVADSKQLDRFDVDGRGVIGEIGTYVAVIGKPGEYTSGGEKLKPKATPEVYLRGLNEMNRISV